jgi:glycosyltransferase involved in cell wall biosynthesis
MRGAASPQLAPAPSAPSVPAGDAATRAVVFDPGHFTPYYDDSLCRALGAHGAEVRLITSPPLFEAVEPAGHYRVDRLFFRLVGGPLKAWLQRRRHARRMLKAVSYPLGLWRTWRALRGGPPGAFHVQWALAPALDGALMRALGARGWRVVFTAHDPLPGAGRRLAHRQWRWLLGQSHAVIVHTPQQRQRLADAYPSISGRISVIPHGGTAFPLPSAADQARARRDLGLALDRPLLLFFGMIKPYKGLDYLVEAMPRVLACFPRAVLVVAGEPLMGLGSVRRRIAALAIGHAISLRPGFVPGGEVAGYMRAADVVVAPYLEVGASGVVAQAQGHGRAVIVTRVGGLPEFAERDGSGFVVPPRDAGALAEAICRALAEPARTAEMGRRARRRIERENRWSDVARETLALYAGPRRAPAADP